MLIGLQATINQLPKEISCANWKKTSWQKYWIPYLLIIMWD